MALPGETIPSGSKCEECGEVLKHEVLQNANGAWYIGTWCSNDGPYSRESCYFSTKEDAEESLKNGGYSR